MTLYSVSSHSTLHVHSLRPWSSSLTTLFTHVDSLAVSKKNRFRFFKGLVINTRFLTSGGEVARVVPVLLVVVVQVERVETAAFDLEGRLQADPLAQLK